MRTHAIAAGANYFVALGGNWPGGTGPDLAQPQAARPDNVEQRHGPGPIDIVGGYHGAASAP